AGEFDLYAQRVNGAGVPQWTPGGVPVCTANAGQFLTTVVPDGAGGVIVAWEDDRHLTTGGVDIYAQRVNGAGGVQWMADGIPVCVASDDQVFPVLVADGGGGAVVAWHDYRDYATSGVDVYAQRVNGAGVVQWAADGVPVCSASHDQYFPAITA